MIDSRIHLREDTVITLFLLFEEFQSVSLPIQREGAGIDVKHADQKDSLFRLNARKKQITDRGGGAGKAFCFSRKGCDILPSRGKWNKAFRVLPRTKRD